MDRRERASAHRQLQKESEARGRQLRKGFESQVRKQVTAALADLGFQKVSGDLLWNRAGAPGRIDSFGLGYDHGNHHPEALRYFGSAGVSIEAIEAAKGTPLPAPGDAVHGVPFPIPGRASERDWTTTYEVNAEVALDAVCAQIIEDATAAASVLDALDVTSLPPLLAFYADNPREQAFAHAAFGDLEGARAAYPRRQGRPYDRHSSTDGPADRLGIDPGVIPPACGYHDQAEVTAALRAALGRRLRMANSARDGLEVTLEEPVTDEDRATVEAIVPTPVVIVGVRPFDATAERAAAELWKSLMPILAAREAVVPDLIAHAPSMGGTINVEVADLDPVTEALLRRLVPEERLSLYPPVDPVAARLAKRDRLRLAADGISPAEPLAPEIVALIAELEATVGPDTARG